jgi:hypothetical protein
VDGERDRPLLGRRPRPRLLEQQRDTKRAPSRRSELVERLECIALDQVAERREREPCLGARTRD